MISKETSDILAYISLHAPIRPNLIVKDLKLSEKTVYKHLSKLLQERKIQKSSDKGKSFYTLPQEASYISDAFDNLDDLIIENNYIYVTPYGDMIRGLIGFKTWTDKNNLDYKKEKTLYLTRFKSVQKFKRNGLVSGSGRILSGSKDLSLDEVFFSDFYNFDHFGKTKLGQLVYISKTSQNIDLIYEIARIIKPSINFLIQKYSIEHICYIPPTVDRKIQFMDVLAKDLAIDINKIKIEKVASKTKIAQKTLKKLTDRIINAKNTIAVSPVQKINGNVLMIDDATGSGATLNETAKKIRVIADKKIKIIGYTVVGSYKGFDVISEV